MNGPKSELFSYKPNTNIILEDSRQKTDKHTFKHKYFADCNIEIIRSKLIVGDYMLPVGPASIDTKNGIMELASNLRQQHKRFRAECELANKLGIQLYILVENNEEVESLDDLYNWVEPKSSFFMRKSKNTRAVRISGRQLAKSANTMSDRYSVQFEFCSYMQAGCRIMEILENFEKMRNSRKEIKQNAKSKAKTKN